MTVVSKLDRQTLFLTIDDPAHRNSLGLNVGKKLLEEVKRIENNPPKDLRAVVINAKPCATKSGKKVWIAGGNLKELETLSASDAKKYTKLYSKIGIAISNLPVPVVCHIDGQAIGGGAELAMWCDIRIMSKESSFIFKQTKVGLATGYGSCQRIVSLLGLSKAQKLLLLGEEVMAIEAEDSGLCHFSNGQEDLEKVLNDIIGNTYEGLKLQKSMLALSSRKASIKKENKLFKRSWLNPDHIKFLKNFIKKSVN